jgi:hypothetical protein
MDAVVRDRIYVCSRTFTPEQRRVCKRGGVHIRSLVAIECIGTMSLGQYTEAQIMRMLARCFVVSLVIALVDPLINFVVIAPVNWRDTPSIPIPSGTSGSTIMIPDTRQLFGIEKYQYIFATGGVLELYMLASANVFVATLVAGLAVSVWNGRKRVDA